MLLSHAGEDVDERLAAEVPDIDVIVGGHSHSRLPSGNFVWRSEDLPCADANGTVIVQAHQWGGELGRLDLLFEQDAEGRLARGPLPRPPAPGHRGHHARTRRRRGRRPVLDADRRPATAR